MKSAGEDILCRAKKVIHWAGVFDCYILGISAEKPISLVGLLRYVRTLKI